MNTPEEDINRANDTFRLVICKVNCEKNNNADNPQQINLLLTNKRRKINCPYTPIYCNHLVNMLS